MVFYHHSYFYKCVIPGAGAGAGEGAGDGEGLGEGPDDYFHEN